MSTPAGTHVGARTDEMHRAPGVCIRNLRTEHLCAVDGRTCRGHARDEDLCAKHSACGQKTQTASGDGWAHLAAVSLERVADPPPMSDLQRGDGRAEGHCVEAEEAVAEDYWVLRCDIYKMVRAASLSAEQKKMTYTCS